MNLSVYIFGNLSSGYTQYPNDYAKSIFEKFYQNSQATTQIAIHRDGDLMYYGYIRKLENRNYLGLCTVINGKMLAQIDQLFGIYEGVIESMVRNGYLIHFNDNGEISSRVDQLYENSEEIDLISASLQSSFDRLESYSRQLPAVSYATSKDSVNSYYVLDNLDEIIKSSYTNGYTYIYKSKGFNTAQLNSYKGVLSKAYKDKKELTEKYEKLQAEHAKTLKQKKQFKFVLILFVVLLGCAIGLFSLNDNLNITRDALSSANDTISMQNDSLSSKTVQISNLHTENHELERSRQAEESRRLEAENNLEDFKSKIRNRQPFIVKSTSFSFSSGYLSFDYYGMTEGNVSIMVKAFNDSGESYTNKANIYIEEGDNSSSIYVSRNLDRDKWYSFELLKDNVILGGDRHKLISEL